MNKGVSIFDRDGRRVVKGMGIHPPKQVRDLKELVRKSVNTYGEKTAFMYKTADNSIEKITYNTFGRNIESLGTALINLGLRDKRIAILSENRYEWAVSYYAIVNGTGIVVPLDKYLPQTEIENLVIRGEIEAILYSPSFHSIMKQISSKMPQIKLFACFENIEEDTRFTTFEKLLSAGEKLLEGGDRSFVDAEVDRYGMSILLFTSGTTNLSKGVMLSHANIASNVTGATTIIKTYPEDIYLSLLPLHHTFENTVGMNFMIHCGITIAYCQGIRHITSNIAEFNVSLLVAVPAILEAVYKKVAEQIEKSGKKKIFDRMIFISQILRKFGIDVRRKLFATVFEKLGPKLRLAVSGAAPLDMKVITGFDKLGLKVIQGYGLTETAPILAANNDVNNVFGTIGHPISGVELSIDNPDESGMGEILAKGKNVMLGYFNDEQATREAFTEDGWFKTGDLGIIDEYGNLKITGRAKSMIVLNNGKKAFPEEYETILNNIENVKESFAWGNVAPDGDIQVCGCIVVDREFFWSENGVPVVREDIRKKIEQGIKEMNSNLPQYKILRYFVFTTEELIKTTTMKIKRKQQYEVIKSWLDKEDIDMRKASTRLID